MSVLISDGEIAAIRFIRIVCTKAPDEVKSQLESYIKNNDWSSLLQWSKPLLPRFNLSEFTQVELAEVAPLTTMRQDVYLFLKNVENSTNLQLKEAISKLQEWGGWESIAKIVQDNPKIPFQFTGTDVQAVLDPVGKLPALTHSQIQAKTFLNTIANDPKAARLKEMVAKMQQWGGWESIAKIVQDDPKIPFQFNGSDVKALLDTRGQITERSITQIESLLSILSFYSTLEQKSKQDEEVKKFFDDISKRVQHGCWKSIADIVNNNEKIPFKGFTVPDLKLVLDPEDNYGDDPICQALKPPVPPAWTVPIVWTIQFGKDAVNWTTGAANDVADWTTGAANDVADWTTGAANDVADWTTGAANDVADWTVGAGKDAVDWTAGAANDVADWTVGAGKDAVDWTAGAANDVADWTVGAGKDAVDWTVGAANDVADALDPRKYFRF